MTHSDLNNYKDAYNQDFSYYDENILMLSWYARRIMKVLQGKGASSILSLGIGHEMVSKTLRAALGNLLDRYVIVEGSSEIIEKYTGEAPLPDNMQVIHSLFETFDPNEKFNAIEMGFILEHVDDPLFILKRFSQFLDSKGVLFIAVPNALSLHRQIGHQAGILDDLYSLSTYDLQLGHKRYFDPNTIASLVHDAGLHITAIEGIYLKPFSTAQLRSLDLSVQVVDALFSLGAKHPEISNALYLEASL